MRRCTFEEPEKDFRMPKPVFDISRVDIDKNQGRFLRILIGKFLFLKLACFVKWVIDANLF